MWSGVGRFIFVGKKSMQKQWLWNVALNLKLELLFENPTYNPKIDPRSYLSPSLDL